jgi:alpha-mannosidase
LNTHFDIGYTHRVRDLIPYCRTGMIDAAMNTMDQMETMPAEQQFLQAMPGWPLLPDLNGLPYIGLK